MKALVFEEPRHATVSDVEVPGIAADEGFKRSVPLDDLTVRVERATGGRQSLKELAKAAGGLFGEKVRLHQLGGGLLKLTLLRGQLFLL